MSSQVQTLLNAALTLSEDDRVDLADGIWNSLGEASKDEMYANHLMSDPEFRAEIESRLIDAEEHPERLVPWEEVKAAMLSRTETASDK